MKNTNTIIIILLVIVIGILTYSTFVKHGEAPSVQSTTLPLVTNPQDSHTSIPQTQHPVVQQNTQQDQKVAALKKIKTTSFNTPIQECVSGGKTYFEVMYSYSDGDNSLYDTNGVLVGSCGGGMRPPNSPNQPTIAAQCYALTQCKTIYNTYAGVSGAKIDVYNIDR
jgi:hypothetical protein